MFLIMYNLEIFIECDAGRSKLAVWNARSTPQLTNIKLRESLVGTSKILFIEI